MATYVMRLTEANEEGVGKEWDLQSYTFAEAPSMKEAVASLGISAGIVEVWTLAQSLTPKTFHLRTETRVVVEEGPTPST